MSPRTRSNLRAAMECDAVGAATYQRFAARARLEGDWELAQAFQETADADRTEHFAKELDMQGTIGDTPENLRKAVEAEKREIGMFDRFAHEAIQDGDRSAAAAFEKIRRDKVGRCAKFEAILAEIGIHSGFQTITQ